MSRILTGVQSTGTPHLGNILGAILPAIEMSKSSGNESFLFIAVLSNVLFFSCVNSKRDLYPEDLIGGFELLSAEKTGIDFNNIIR